MTAKQGTLKDYKYERTNMAYKCKIFETLNLTLHGHYAYVCTVFKVISINTEKKCLPNKEYISGH